ncbi:hypothetical protein skT53_34100 [Effusibacillus dendaii]|uniref:Uncharacterized protein n=1 Tax=Effusibacillus dendaii TaxID=2743772 RepID=A0A7I8DEE8_9BACL|nr:hypothetical protein skT53_34100 [Effusibacillus dendaii]
MFVRRIFDPKLSENWESFTNGSAMVETIPSGHLHLCWVSILTEVLPSIGYSETQIEQSVSKEFYELMKRRGTGWANH